MSSKRTRSDDAPAVPRAVIHKQILEAARADADASIEALANQVAGASVPLVDRVLEEYGDPCEADQPSGTEPETSDSVSTDEPQSDTMSDASSNDTQATDRTLDALTDKQRDVLAEIEARPDATQQDLAETLDLSQATISNHLNAIDGFEWTQRRSFVASMPTDEPTDPTTQPAGTDTPEPSSALAETVDELTDELDALQRRLDDLDVLEQRLDALETRIENHPTAQSTLADPELTAKVIHASMNADAIERPEELRIIEHLTTDTT